MQGVGTELGTPSCWHVLSSFRDLRDRPGYLPRNFGPYQRVTRKDLLRFRWDQHGIRAVRVHDESIAILELDCPSENLRLVGIVS